MSMSMFAINFEAASQAPPVELLSISLTSTSYSRTLRFHVSLYDLLHGPNRPITRIGYGQFRIRDCEPPCSSSTRLDHEVDDRLFEIKVQEEIIGFIPHFVFNVRWVYNNNEHGTGTTTTQASVLLTRPPREPGLDMEEVLKDQVVQKVGAGGFGVYILGLREV